MVEVMNVFHYTDNLDGSPNPDRAMTKEKYSEYRNNDDMMYANLMSTAKEVTAIAELPARSIDVEKLNMLNQGTFKDIPYPAANVNEERTVAKYGMFQVMAKVVLDYFDVPEVSLEDITKISVWGDWHHPRGTWHHFVDVMLSAYGLKVRRIDDFNKVYLRTRKNSVVLALLKNRLFPDGRGNSLVLITNIDGKTVSVYHPAYGNQVVELNWGAFAFNTLKLWSVTKD